MSAKDLAIIIPSRNEEFLKNTVEDLLKNKRGKTEIIVGLDGQWSNPSLIQHPDVCVIYVPESVGQRAMSNMCARLTKAKYIMKLDAHCSVDEGFDVKMLEAFKKTGDNVVMAPLMRNLHVFNWLCKCGFTHYQDKGSLCPECKSEMTKEMVWEPRKGTRNYAYCFDTDPHFQYHSAHRNTDKFKKEAKTGLTESMSLQGSCFVMTKENYLGLNIDDEAMGSWGSQGLTVACKFWLSGGRVLTNHKTWYAHCFRTKQANGFGFPYPQSGKQIDGAKKMAKDLFFGNKWDKAIHPLSWLIERFMPISIMTKDGKQIGWTQEALDNLKMIERGEKTADQWQMGKFVG